VYVLNPPRFLNAAALNGENRVASVTIHQLRIFESVARHLSFSGAARELDIVQPAVYLQIKSLEDSCGVKLYRKVGRQIVLSVESARFRDQLGQILPRLKELEGGTRPSAANQESLAIGGSHLLSAAVLAPAFVLSHEFGTQKPAG
jgi:DNA-binding transcriptional LysR family regulator